MNGRELAAWAELLQLHAIWIVTTVLLGDVVAFFAIYARHGDLWPNIGALAGHDDSPRFEPWKTQVGFPIRGTAFGTWKGYLERHLSGKSCVSRQTYPVVLSRTSGAHFWSLLCSGGRT